MNAFRHSRVFPYAPAAVFAALADPARLARWWGPAGFSNTFQTFELVEGGRWVFTMHGPDGQNYHNESVFESLEVDRRLVVRHVVAPLFRLSIELVAQEGGTRVDWVQVFDDDAVAAAVQAIVEPANEQNLDRWAAELARTP